LSVVETLALPPEIIAGDRSPSVRAPEFGGTPIWFVGAGAAAEFEGPTVAFPPLTMAGEPLPRVVACCPPDHEPVTQPITPNKPITNAPVASRRSIDARSLAGSDDVWSINRLTSRTNAPKAIPPIPATCPNISSCDMSGDLVCRKL
jgi:hypothetical protein